jgi:hypothetical protein
LKRVLAAVSAIVVLLAVAAPAPATGPPSTKAKPKPPTRAQIHTALRRAEASPNLWATVNICNTRRHPGVVGIRAQMPALGFEATLRMRFEVDYWSARAKVFRPVPGARQRVTLGTQRTGLHQEGVQFSFPPHSGSLRGRVKFEWVDGRRLLGRSIQNTTRGHRAADFGDPAHYSAPRCLIR